MRSRGNRAVAAAAFATLAVCASHRALAANGSWTGAGADNTWSTAANWDTVPGTTGGLGGGNTDTALFSGTPAVGTVSIDTGRNIANITFDNVASTTNIGIGAVAGNTLFLSNGGIAEATATMPGNLTTGQNALVNAPMVLAGTSYTFRANFANTASLNFNTNGTLSAGTAAASTIFLDGTNFDSTNQGQSFARIQSVITNGAGTVGVTKNGAGTWELRPGGVTDGSPAGTSFPTNTYSGPTTINQGILRISGPGGASPNSDLVVNPTGAVRFSVNVGSTNNPGLHPTFRSIIINTNNSGQTGNLSAGSLNASNSSSQTIVAPPSGPGITLNYQNETAAADLTGNVVILLRGTADRDGGVKFNSGASNPNFVWGRGTAPLDLGALNRPFDISRSGNAANTIDFDCASPITGTGGIIKTGNGIMRNRGVVAPTGNPVAALNFISFTGPIEVNDGTLIQTGTGNSGVSPLLVNGGTFDIQGTNQAFGAATLTSGAFKSSTGVYMATSYTANVVGANVGTFNAILGNGSLGASGLTKIGSGLARLHASATYTGTTTVSDGTLRVAADAAIGASSGLVLNGSGVLLYSDARADAVLAPSLSVSGTAALDLGDNDMVVQSATPKSTIETYVRNGRNAGAWNGSGIVSNDARTNTNHTTGLGVLSGAEYNTVGGTGVFGAQGYAAGDTLIKYTYNGDANFDGRITFDDYVKIDTGFNTGLTGWFNGDFNYSGAVNFDDYVLIDIAFNQQAGTLGRAVNWISGDDRSATGLSGDAIETMLGHLDQFGSAYGAAFLAAVPEPTSLALLGIPAMAGMIGRRRRHP